MREGDDSRATAAELGGPGGAYRQWIIQQNFFSECRFHGALPIPLYDMLFEMPAGLDPLPIPPNDDILLPDDDLPPPPVQKPKAKRKRKEIKFLTEDELARLFSVIPSVRDRAMFQIAYRAGLRASEVGLLQLRDYDPKADRIFIHRLKGSNSSHHHLMREEARALRAWLKVRGSFPGPIFLSKQKRPIDRTTLHLLMKKYGAAAGIPEKLRHFHVLKHFSQARSARTSSRIGWWWPEFEP